MAPNRTKGDKDRKVPQDEYEVAYYTKELGRALQRKKLQGLLDDFTNSGIRAAGHGEDPPADEQPLAPPSEDRAG
jgi:hypothetical protein